MDVLIAIMITQSSEGVWPDGKSTVQERTNWIDDSSANCDNEAVDLAHCMIDKYGF